jgi:hypothetical protein
VLHTKNLSAQFKTNIVSGHPTGSKEELSIILKNIFTLVSCSGGGRLKVRNTISCRHAIFKLSVLVRPVM